MKNGISLAIWLVCAMAGRAHDTWLLPERFTATPGAVLRFELTSAPVFNQAETSIKAESVARATFLLGGEAPAIGAGPGEEGEHALRFSATLSRPGVAVMGVELKPHLLEREPEKIELYFRAIHAGQTLRADWARVPEPQRWRERVVKTAKTFVRVGEPPSTDRTWATSVGAGLEIIPERDPTTMRTGEELPVRVVYNGRPLAGLALGYISAGETREYVVITDREGRARARLDVAGSWLVHGTFLRRVVEPQLEWKSDFTAMVVEVR